MLLSLPLPSSISYSYSFGSILGLSLSIQIITGLFLSIYYIPSMAFDSIEYITSEVNYGYIFRYIHINVATCFFIFLYIHILRNLFYCSYNKQVTFSIGTIIILLSMATAFLGYTLPEGQISLWGSTVIINIFSTISPSLLPIIWGSPSPSIYTTSRFFILHYILPFIIATLSLIHLITGHTEFSYSSDTIKFHPYFSTKDIISFVPFIILQHISRSTILTYSLTLITIIRLILWSLLHLSYPSGTSYHTTLS